METETDDMMAVNKRTGSPILGTLETLQGRGDISGIRIGEDGGIEFDQDGNTEVFWDGAETATDKAGKPIFLDRAGDEVQEQDIIFVSEERAQDMITRERLTADLKELKNVIELLEEGTAEAEDEAAETLAYIKSLEEAVTAEVEAIQTREESKSPDEKMNRHIREGQSFRGAIALVTRSGGSGKTTTRALEYLRGRQESIASEIAAMRENRKA